MLPGASPFFVPPAQRFAPFGKAPAQATKDERQFAKAVNYGRPGGMGAKTLARDSTANYGAPMTEPEAAELKEAYERQFPEVADDLDLGR